MRGWSKIGIGVAMSLVLVTACSSGGGGGASTSPSPDRVTAEAYVKVLCGGIQTWLTKVQSLSNDFTSNLDPTASPGDQAAAVGSFLDDVITATETLVADVKAAGVPDVTGGGAAATALTTAFQRVDDALKQARGKVDAMPTGDPAAFNAALTQLGTDIQTTLSGIGNSIGTLTTSGLDQAFSSEPTCQSLASPSP